MEDAANVSKFCYLIFVFFSSFYLVLTVDNHQVRMNHLLSQGFNTPTPGLFLFFRKVLGVSLNN